MKMSWIHAAVFTSVICVLIFCVVQRSGAADRTYEVRPEIDAGLIQGETMRVVAAYERLMDRYMDLVQSNLVGIDRDSQQILIKLEAIERKIDKLSERMDRMEKGSSE